MQEICAQITNHYDLRPWTDEDKDALRDFSQNQIVKLKVTGPRKQRSYQQLKLYFACCKKVADNTDDPEWNTKEKVDFNCRVQCRLIKNFRVIDGVTYIEPRSISYAEMKHIEACNYFDRAFEVMAKVLGVRVDDLVSEAMRDG